MTTAARQSKLSKYLHYEPILDPLERSSEILFGVIMVMTFTVSLRVARADRLAVHEMLIGALGCNLAWGVIDGIMYIMSCVSERGHNFRVVRRVHRAKEPKEADRIIADALPTSLAAVMPESAVDAVRKRLLELPEPPARPRLKREDWLGAVGVFNLVFFSTFPLVLPFLVIPHVRAAARLSDAIALVILFFAGRSYGRYAGHSARGWGISMVAIGCVMVGLTIGLGG